MTQAARAQQAEMGGNVQLKRAGMHRGHEHDTQMHVTNASDGHDAVTMIRYDLLLSIQA
jgi:hypothetical protein